MHRLRNPLWAWLFLLASAAGAGCSVQGDQKSPERGFRVGMVLDKGGKDDRSFNSAAYEGFMRAKKELGISGKFVEASDDNSFEPMLRAMARKGFNLVIAIGVSQAEAVQKVAASFPRTEFAIVDGTVTAPNVRSLLFQEQEGAYLVGALAALTSKTGKVGFIGGMDIPLIRRFELGYRAGAGHVNPRIEVFSNYVGVTGDAWNNPAKAKELALAQYGRGADVIFSAAGASGNGLFDAAEETRKLAIGCDSDQNWVKPGFILSSMLKHVDLAVYDVIGQAMKGRFQPGIRRYGIADHGVDYAMDKYNEALVPPGVRAKLEGIRAEIVSGAIRVPDYYERK